METKEEEKEFDEFQKTEQDQEVNSDCGSMDLSPHSM